MVKHIDDLTVSDFAESPRWMFYGGKNSEYDSFVTLIPESHQDFDGSMVCLISATYTSRSGNTLKGYYYDDPQKEDHHIFIGKVEIDTWRGVREPSDDQLIEIYRKVGFTKEDFFPLSYTSYHGERSGIIEGVYYLSSENKVCFKT